MLAFRCFCCRCCAISPVADAPLPTLILAFAMIAMPLPLPLAKRAVDATFHAARRSSPTHHHSIITTPATPDNFATAAISRLPPPPPYARRRRCLILPLCHDALRLLRRRYTPDYVHAATTSPSPAAETLRHTLKLSSSPTRHLFHAFESF